MEDTDFVLIARTTENTTFQGEPREKNCSLINDLPQSISVLKCTVLNTNGHFVNVKHF